MEGTCVKIEIFRTMSADEIKVLHELIITIFYLQLNGGVHMAMVMK